ncbi:helix-turn-helix domain-containing protein [Nocardia blacklockiae]|uniref:helix-turn-helix domain-containing protein n=1 Tax=Nocardia blacklockiae TaxID=480036 RepID=UPI001895E3B4|nr:helix-turn-helix transcriptional regulator [Nocardia blacklockiae]MBF6170788.1 helix-turn-helix transcriptional regulator [Nocardia blacklockiae]
MRRDRLIEVRKSVGKNQEQIAEAVRVDRTTVGKWERGESTPQPNQRAAYAEALGITVQELSAMLTSIPQGEGEMPAWLSTYLGMEQSSTRIRAYEPRCVYGLLQITPYIEDIVSHVSYDGVSPSYIQRTVETRHNRQKRVLSGEVELDLVQPESALRLRIGTPAVMQEQLQTMVELSELPNVTLRVTTFDAGQYEARRLGGFGILYHPWGTPQVHIEGYGGGRFINDAEEVNYFQGVFEHATRVALTPTATRKFIAGLAKEWREK